MGGRIATMIVTVTLNAALDVAYDVEALVPHATHRVLEVRARAGGKGVNVARVLRQLGQDAVVTGLAGGHTGTLIRADLAASGLPDALVPISRESRRTLAIVSRRDGGATLLNEPGPQVREEEWAGLLARFDRLLAAAQAVMLSGSLPVGVPTSAYAELVQAAHDHGLPALVDAEGEALHAALLALRTWSSRMPRSCAPRPAMTIPPWGPGRSCGPALAAGLAGGHPWPETLREAVAVSAAAVLLPCGRRLRPHGLPAVPRRRHGPTAR